MRTTLHSSNVETHDFFMETYNSARLFKSHDLLEDEIREAIKKIQSATENRQKMRRSSRYTKTLQLHNSNFYGEWVGRLISIAIVQLRMLHFIRCSLGITPMTWLRWKQLNEKDISEVQIHFPKRDIGFGENSLIFVAPIQDNKRLIWDKRWNRPSSSGTLFHETVSRINSIIYSVFH